MSPKIFFFGSARPENLCKDSPGVVLQGRLAQPPTVIAFGRQRTTFLTRAAREDHKSGALPAESNASGGLSGARLENHPRAIFTEIFSKKGAKRVDFRCDAVPAGGREDDLFFSCARACEYIRDTTRGGGAWLGGWAPAPSSRITTTLQLFFTTLKTLATLTTLFSFLY